ncbi:LysR substrate-binding domain-containing protein [Myroides sp. LJL119]
MLDFRLKVFYVVAQRLNFTKAAEELFISQPAVSKHIHELESLYNCKFFQRKGSRIKLTTAGEVLLKYTEDIFNIHKQIELELSALNKDVKGVLQIGASTTVAQYFIPAYLASFKQRFPDIRISLSVNNTENIENLVLQNKINLAIVEGHSKRKDLKYVPIYKDEIVLCTKSTNPNAVKAIISKQDLLELPLVIRESGSGSREVLMAKLKQLGVVVSDLKIDIEFESTESIKSYLLNSNSYAFVSINSIFNELKTGVLKIIDINEIEIERFFYLITQQGDISALNDLFLRHLALNNLRL